MVYMSKAQERYIPNWKSTYHFVNLYLISHKTQSVQINMKLLQKNQ